MFAIMCFQRVRRLKFLWLEGSWIQRKVPALTPLCTKAKNVKKPVRYTSIKKAKPKTINDIARLLQQKTKETKERKQSVIPALKAATSTTKPATPHQLNDQSDAKATIVSNAKVQTSTSTLPAIVTVECSSESATLVDTKPVQYIVDVEAVTGSSLNVASKLPVAASRTFCETTPDTVLIDSAVDFAYSKCVDQMAMEGLHNKTCSEISNATDAAPKAVDSGVESPISNVPQEASTQEDTNANISQVPELSSTNTKEISPSSEDVASASKKLKPEVDEIVNMPKVTANSEVSSAHEDSHLEESFSDSEVVTVTNASTFVNTAQARYSSQPSQSQYFIAPNWPSNVNADKTPSSEQIINQAVGSVPVGAAESIMDISSVEAVAVACGEVPTLREVCHEEAIPVSDPIPEASLFKSTGDLPAVETISASLSKAVKVDDMSEMSGDAQSSINLKDPILAQTDVLEEEMQKEEAFEELPEAQLDPIQRLFLDKIREYSAKSQASGGLVDAGPEYEKAFNEELTTLQRLYGGGDLSKFPEFKFSGGYIFDFVYLE
ncbi:platelet binding protein GspB isoform X1 [Chanodichthys erythropterus]|uniref:platelet binding protein GspB isoform X1 n=1 Tax=Chanodichthys erythropterus TaxID=933992 RepID=UPI00351F3CA2